MTSRDKVGEALVGGVTGLAVVVVYLIARAAFEGADAGDWLAFAGAMTGIGGATFTAIYVADRTRRLGRRDDLNLLKGSLEDLGETVAKMVRGDVDESDRNRQKDNIIFRLADLNLGREVFAHARATSRIDDVTLWRRVRIIEITIEKYAKVIEREIAIVGNNEPTDDILRVHRERAQELADDIGPLLDSALDRIEQL